MHKWIFISPTASTGNPPASSCRATAACTLKRRNGCPCRRGRILPSSCPFEYRAGCQREGVAGAHLVLAVMRNVCVELSEVLMRELLVLQLYDDTAMQNAVVEHKVGIIVLVVNDNALLAGLEAEALAEFEDELLQVSYKCILQVMLIHVFYRIIVTTVPLKSGH